MKDDEKGWKQVATEQRTRYLLHYIGQGRGVYSIKSFTAEARRHGVNRAFPRNMIKRLRWGDKVLLAEWRRYKEHNPDNLGDAEVFGYFIVSGLNFANAPEGFMERLKDKLEVVWERDYSGGIAVSRRCGSYSVGSAVFINDTLEETMEKVEVTLRELRQEEAEETGDEEEKDGEEPKKRLKIFVGGRFVSFEDSPFNFLLPDQPWTRSGIWVDLPMAFEGEAESRHIWELDDYKRKRYVRKRAKKNFAIDDFESMAEVGEQ